MKSELSVFEKNPVIVDIDFKVEMILQLYVKLKSSTVDYYSISELDPNATAEEINQAYDDFVHDFFQIYFLPKPIQNL